eukprot:266018_1
MDFVLDKTAIIIKEGWLYKRSRHLNIWRKRWVVLTEKKLFTFKHEQIYKQPTETIELSDIIDIRHVEKKPNKILVNLFTINLQNHAYEFMNQMNKCDDWLNAIKGYRKCFSIPINVKCDRNNSYDCNFQINIPYHPDYHYAIFEIIEHSMAYINKKFQPIEFTPKQILSNSFIGQQIIYGDYDWKDCDINITDYEPEFIQQQGIYLTTDVAIFEHKVSFNNIKCTDMKDLTELCPIYAKIRYQDIFTEEYLNHLYEFEHYQHIDTPECKFSDGCYAYKRLEAGGDQLRDRCHVQLYRHPPRRRKFKSASDINSFCLNDEWFENIRLHQPTMEDQIHFEYDDKSGYLKALTTEVIANGYKNDLYLKTDSERNNGFSIMHIVDEKLNCIRHQKMGSPLNKAEMLAIVLYTGCECYEELTKSQRKGNYETWKWF